MTEQPVHILKVSYTKDDYDAYFRFYKSVLKKTPIKLVFYFLVSVVIGFVVGYYVNWLCLGLFIIIGAVMDCFILWSQKQIDKKVYEQEKKSMPITYRFFEDNMEIETASGDKQIANYHDFYTIYEVETAFYLMLDKETVAIVPKRACSDELAEFILGLGEKKEKWLASQSA